MPAMVRRTFACEDTVKGRNSRRSTAQVQEVVDVGVLPPRCA